MASLESVVEKLISDGLAEIPGAAGKQIHELLDPVRTIGTRSDDNWANYALALSVANSKALLEIARRLDEQVAAL